MKPDERKILMLTAFSLILMGECFAQPKSIGATFSISGISVSYEHYTDSDSFMDLSLKAECGDLFLGKAAYPGISAAFTWNLIFARMLSRNGNEVRFYAGPGMVAGWANDLYKPEGVIFGLKGRIGAECSFSRNITLSASVAPVIGTHMLIGEDFVDMRYYRMGLLSVIMPEIGIRYTF